MATLPRIRRSRAALCTSTALQAAALVVLAGPAGAQPAAGARPTGGQVSAGQASIGGNATTTLVSQASQNAAITWRTFDVGSGQTVRYAQPNAASFTLNRVIAAQPSQIAGHIVANGRIAVVNQSGVVFLAGSTVDTAGLVVSAAGITDADFMAGRMVFGNPARAGATVSNAGTITIRQAGLVALVAPQVANSGTITALLGRVILGGATTHTLDLYGDGLVALNVTGQVTEVQVAGHPVTALITNTGTILAPGGTVVLTAQAADGVVTTAVSAGGVIAAPTTAGQAGRVLVSGIGGDVEVDGIIAATGADAAGGRVQVTSDHRVAIRGGALVDASGDTGGGAVSIGTSTHVQPGQTPRQTLASATTIAPNAMVRARAWRTGRGGQVAIASRGTTSVQGAVSAQGGDATGDGGRVDVSGASVDLAGQVTTRAAHGLTGLLDVAGSGAGQAFLIENVCPPGGGCTPYGALANQAVNNLVSLSNAGDIDFLFSAAQGPNGFSSATLSLAVTTTPFAGQRSNVNVDAGVAIAVPTLSIVSAGGIFLDTLLGDGPHPSPAILTAASSMTLSAGGDILAGPATRGGTAPLPGEILTPTLAITNAGNVRLDSGANVIGALSGISDTAGATAVSGSVTLVDASGLSVTGPISATGSVSITVTGAQDSLLVGSGPNGAGGIGGSGVTLTAAANVLLGAAVSAGAGTLSIEAQGGDVTGRSGLTAGVLAAHGSGSILLDSAGNAFTTIGTGAGTVSGLVADGGNVIVSDAVALTIAKPVSAAGAVFITVTGAGATAPNALDLAANVTGANVFLSTGGSVAGFSGAALTVAAGATVDAAGSPSGGGGIARLPNPGAASLTTAQGDIVLAGALQAGTANAAGIFPGSVSLHAGSGAIRETTGSILAGTLSASATGDILLATPSTETGALQTGNQIAIIGFGQDSVSGITAGGRLTLVDGQDLSVATTVTARTGMDILVAGGSSTSAASTLSVLQFGNLAGSLALTTAGTIALAADVFVLTGSVSVPAGLVALDVAHPGAFTVADTGGTIGPAGLGHIATGGGTLALGSRDGANTGNTTDLLIATGAATGSATLDLTSIAATLGLFGTFLIQEQDPGAAAPGIAGIRVGALYGSAGGPIDLSSANNLIDAIAAPLASTAGAITLTDATSLAVNAGVTAAGTVTLAVNAPLTNAGAPATLAIGAAVTGADVTLTTAILGGQIPSTDPGSSIAIRAGADVTAAGSAAAPGTITLAAAFGGIDIAGSLSALTGTTINGTIALTATAGNIIEQPTGALSAGALTATAGFGSLPNEGPPIVVGGTIDLSSGATAGAGAAINRIATLSGASAAANLSLTDNASLAVTGPVAAGGNLTLAVDTQAGGPVTNTLAIGAGITGQSVSLSTAGSAGTAPAIALSVFAHAVVSASGTPGSAASPGSLTLSADQGSIALSGTLANAGGAVSLDASTGGIAESLAGAILARALTADALGDISLVAASGTLAGTPIGNQVATLSAAATLGRFDLVDGQALTVAGALTAGPEITLATPALTVTAAAGIGVAARGKIQLRSDGFVIGGDLTAAGGLVALDLLTGGVFSVVAGSATGLGQIGVADLSHVTTGTTGTLALGTTDGLSPNGTTPVTGTWTLGSAGPIMLLQVLAPLDPGSTAGTLGLFSNGAIVATGPNALTVGSLYGAAGTGITLDAAANRISALASLAQQDAVGTSGRFGLVSRTGDIVLADAQTLSVNGAVAAPAGRVTVTVTGTDPTEAAPDALHVNADIGGQDVTLSTAGFLPSFTDNGPASRILTVASTATVTAFGNGGTPGTLSASTAQGDMDLAGTLSTGVQPGLVQLASNAGNITETDPAFSPPTANIVPTGSIVAGTLAVQAGTLEGAAPYSILLDSHANTIGTLTGFGNARVSSATSTFSITDQTSLTIGAGALVEAGNTIPAAPDTSLSITVNGALLIEGTLAAGALTPVSPGQARYAGALSLRAATDIAEADTGHVLAGTLTAGAQGSVRLDGSPSGNVVGTLGASIAGENFVLLDSVVVAPGTVLAGQTLVVTGDVAAQTGSLVLAVSGGDLNLQPANLLSAGTAALLSADLGVLQEHGRLTAAVVSFSAGGAIAQFAGTAIDALGSAGSAPSITMTANGGSPVTLADGATITLFGIALGGTDTASAGAGRGRGSIALVSALGDISQAAPSDATTAPPSLAPPTATGAITTDSLSFQAGTPGSPSAITYSAWLNAAANQVGTLAGGISGATGNILLMDAAPLTIAADTLVQSGQSPDGSGALSIHSTGAIAIDGTLQAGSLAALAGTGFYNGALTLTADTGSLTEGGAGRILASTVAAGAMLGDVTLASPGNNVATLLASQAGGSLAFTDSAIVAPGVALPDQALFIQGAVTAGNALAIAVTGGNLDLEPGAILRAITAALSADLGVAQFGGSLTAGAVTITAGAEIAQFQGAAITATGTTIGRSPVVAASIILKAAGGFADDLILPDGNRVSLFGIALGGTDIAGSPGSIGYVILRSPGGDISQAQPTDATAVPPSAGPPSPTGTLATGTLSFQAGTFESGTAYSARLNGTNQVGSLSGLFLGTSQPDLVSGATGSIVLLDQAALTIGAGVRVEAGGASLSNALAIEDTGGNLSILGTLQAGVPPAGPGTGSTGGTLSLLADTGSVTEGTAAALLGNALTVNAPHGDILLAAPGNGVASLAGASTAGGSFIFADNAVLPGGATLPHHDVTIAGIVTAATGSLAIAITGGNLDLGPDATLSAATAASLQADLGVVQFGGSVTAGTVDIRAGAEVAQFAGASITADAAAPTLSIQAGGGTAGDLLLPGGGTLSLFGIALGGTDSAAGNGAGSIRLVSAAGDISQTSPAAGTGTPPTPTGELATDTLAFQAGTPGTGTALFNAWLNAPSNSIASLAGLPTGNATPVSGATGTVNVLDATGLLIRSGTTLEAVNAAGQPSALILHTLDGDIVIAGALASGLTANGPGSLSLVADAGTIAEAGGSILAGTLAVQAGRLNARLDTSSPPFSVSLNNAANAVGTLSGLPGATGPVSGASGSITLADSAALTIAAGALVEAGTSPAQPGAVSIHDLAGIIIDGTLQAGAPASGAYAGTMTLLADAGSITEAPDGRVLAGTLTVDAAAAAVALAGAGNVISVLAGTNIAAGAFTLTDNAAGLPLQTALTTGSIQADTIGISITGGNLDLGPAAHLASSTALNIAAGLGVVQYGGTITGQTIRIVSGEEIGQFAGAAIVASANGQPNPSITLQAGAHDLAAGYADDVVLPDGHTVTLHGIALGGLVSATNAARAGALLLSTPAGDISQAAPDIITTGSPGTAPPATGSLLADTLQFQAGTLPGTAADAANAWLNSATNQVGTLGIGPLSFAAGSVDLADTTALSLASGTTLSATGQITLTLTGHTLTQATGNTVLAGGSVLLDAILLAQQAGATLDAGEDITLAGSATQASRASIAAAGNVALGGALTQSGAMLSASRSITIGGDANQAAGTLTAQTGRLTIGGKLAQSAASTLTAAGAVTIANAATQDASALTAGGATTIGGTLAQNHATLLSGGSVTVAGDATQSASAITAQAGPVSIGGNLTQSAGSNLAATAGNATIDGAVSQHAGTLTAGQTATIAGTLAQTDGTVLAGAIGVAGNTTQTAGTLAARSGAITLGGTLLQTGSTLTAATSVATGGAVSQDTSTLTAGAGATIAGTLAQTHSRLLAAGAVAVLGDVTQESSALTAEGRLSIGGHASQTNHSTLAANTDIAIAAALFQDTGILTAGGNAAIGGTLAQTHAILLAGRSVTVSGNATQTASSLTAQTGTVGIGGTLAQSASSTLAAAAGDVSITGGVVQDASTLTAGGNTTIGGTLAQSGAILLAAGSVAIAGQTAQAGSTLTAQSGSVALGAGLTQSASTLAAGAGIAIASDATQAQGSTLRAGSTLAVGTSLHQSASSATSGGNLTIGGSLDQDRSTATAGGLATISGGGAVAQSATSTLAGATGMDLTLAAGLTQDATSVISSAGGIAIATGAGNIAFEGLLRSGATSAITLVAATGNIRSLAGTLVTGTLAAAAAGGIVLDGTANAIAQVAPLTTGLLALRGLTAGGSLSLQDSTALILADAALTGTAITITLPAASLAQHGGSVAATGDVSITADGFVQDGGTIAAGGAVRVQDTEAGGTLTQTGAATITGSAGVTLLSAGSLLQGTGGTIASPDAAVQISAPGTLAFAGTLAGPRILLGEHALGTTLVADTAAPALIDWQGGTIQTGSALPVIAGAEPDLTLPIAGGTAGSLGLFATATDFRQTGTTAFTRLRGEPRETVQLSLTGPRGTIAFDPLASLTGGLYGPQTQLLLNLGAKGTAHGNIVVAGLNVYYTGLTPPVGGTAALTGSVNGRTGSAAASSGFVHAVPGVNYTVNACPIQSLNCILLSPIIVPLGSPARDVEVSISHRREDDDDLILPNVAEQDY